MRLFVALVGSAGVLAGSCNNSSLGTAFDEAQKLAMSWYCLGPWSYNAKATDILTTWSQYVPLACAQASCRRIFQDSASAIGAIQCDEAQVLGTAMANLVKVCNTLSLANSSLPACSKDNVTNIGAVPTTCSAVAPTASSALDIVQPTDLKTLAAVCQVPSCVADLTSQINALPSCQTDWPHFNGASLVPKDVYLGYLSSFCTNSTPPSVDTSSCSVKLAELLAIPFLDQCSDEFYGNRQAYVIHEATVGKYMQLSRFLATKSACTASVDDMIQGLLDAGPCATNILRAFQILRYASSKAYPSNSSLPLCTSSQNSTIQTLLDDAASVECRRHPLVHQWSDVFLPSNLGDMASIAATPGCAVSAVAIAKTALPPCEVADPARRDAAVGMDAATRFTAFLLAAEVLSTRDTLPPLSKSCVDGAKGLLSDDTSPLDFLKAKSGSVPMACSIDACRQDFILTSAALKSTNSTVGASLGSSVAGIANVCNSWTISTGQTRCTSASPFDIGAVPLECSAVAATAPNAGELVLPSDLCLLSSVCQVPACVPALSARITSLPDCEAAWLPAYGALVSPKEVYRSYLSSFCNTSAFIPTVDFASCSSKLAAAHFLPFSNACYDAMFEYDSAFGGTPVYAAVLLQVSTGKYVQFSRFLASSPACTTSVNAAAAQVDSAGACGTALSLALKAVVRVASTTYPSNNSLVLCTAAQIDALTMQLNAPAAVECTGNNSLVQKWTDVFYPRYSTDMVAAAATPGCAAAAVTYAKTSFPVCEYVDVEYAEAAVGMDAAMYFTKLLLAAQSLVAPDSVTTAPATTATPTPVLSTAPPSNSTTAGPTTATPTPTPTRSAAQPRSMQLGVVLAVLALQLLVM